MKKIAIIGLGYVGLPLAVEFGKKRQVLGFDIDEKRILELISGYDHTFECSTFELTEAEHLSYSFKRDDLESCQIFIITVPTPVDDQKKPDLRALIGASKMVGAVIKPGDLIIYESTVYPGATEEICVPVLERSSGLSYNIDFFCGYSPERINPGDKLHKLSSICKITSGSTALIADEVDSLYNEIILAGTHRASSISVAEAAKVIENTQRDLNIALMNELSLIFSKLNIDTYDVLRAAGTKWNFLHFEPGLVGGHCIGVDPYYLTHKAQDVGYNPEVILAGRRINDNMASHVADETIKLMLKKGIPVLNSNILVLGFSFKENCPDVRNTKVVDLVKTLQTYKANIDIYDPWIDVNQALNEYGIKCLKEPPPLGQYKAIVIAVAHKDFIELGEQGIKSFGEKDVIIYDVKGILPKNVADGRL